LTEISEKYAQFATFTREKGDNSHLYPFWRSLFMPSYKQLTAQLEKLHKEVAAAREKEVAQAIADIKEKIAEYEITAEELGFTSAGNAAARKKTPLPARYANPKTGETWSGRGRAPAWLNGVKNRERFLIKE
jgi:DNA-binding protein H-NS